MKVGYLSSLKCLQHQKFTAYEFTCNGLWERTEYLVPLENFQGTAMVNNLYGHLMIRNKHNVLDDATEVKTYYMQLLYHRKRNN